MHRVRSVIGGGLLLVLLVCGVTAAARAQSVILSLDNVTFDDGGTAAGTISLNQYGYILSVDVTTTPGSSLLPGWSYLVPGPIAPGYFNSQYTLDLYMDATNILLELDVAQAFSATLSGIDQITGGFEECVYGCPGSIPSGTTRSIVLADNADLLVPEPASMALLTGGLLGLGVVRSRGLPCRSR